MVVYFAGATTGGSWRQAQRIYYLSGGGMGSIDETILGEPSHNTKIPKRNANGDFVIRGGTGSKVNEDFSCRSSPYVSQRYRGDFSKIVKTHRPFILESFFYSDKTTEQLLPYFGDFLLDSGAFTFMSSSKTHVEWNDYLERYADFINRNKIEKYFELDIDSVVGYSKVLEYRKQLEKMTNKPCIPVWHVSRGLDEFKRMCDEYSYAAIGGIVSKEIKPEQYKAFPAMIGEAHRRGCKLHGLGFTNLKLLQYYHFDSVDSTAWTTGNRFGYIYQFNGKTMIKHDVPKGKRLADSKKVAEINYLEWLKFQRWAVTNL